MILPKTKTSALILPILTIAMSFFITNTTYAAGNTQDNIVKKSYLQGLGVCYELKNGGTEDDYKEGWGIFTSNVLDDNYEPMKPDQYQLAGEVKTSTYENDFSYKKLFPMEPAKNKIRLPNGWTPENGDSKTNCAHLVNGHNDGFTDTIYDRFNKPEAKVQSNSSADDIKKFMEKMGYKQESGSTENGRKCFTITYDWQKYEIKDDDSWRQLSNEKGSEKSSEVCADIENGIVTKLSYPNDTMDARYLSLGIDYSSGGVTMDFVMAYDPENFDYNCNVMNGMNCYPFGSRLDDGGQEDLAYLYIYDKDYSWDQFYDELEKRVNALKGGKDNFSNVYNGDDYEYAIGLTGKSINVTDSQATDVVWKLNGSRATARNKAISYLNTGNNIGSSYSKLGLTESQAVVLYQHYIKDIAQATVNCSLDSPSSTDVAVKWFESATERKDCYITGYNADETEYNIVDDKGYFTLGVKFSKLVDTLNAMTINTLDGVDDAIESSQSTIGQNQEDPISDSDEEVTCYTAGGSLGWILCPILEFTTDAVDTLYNSVIEPYLVMDATLFTSGSGDKTYEAWQTFQGIANICFVILFIFVIFSQLTGVGIDNYGIKKILPKLITAALLINLSYIICEVAIDISNIVGSGIKSIFDNLMTDVTINSITVENGTNVDGLNTVITGGVALLATIVGAVALYTNGAAILIPLFIAAISVLVSIFFLFVLLSLRKAAVIILVVVSPIAVGCYMLPNTKKLFDRWFKALQGMLLLYPIAGALVGGGNYVSKVLLSTGNGTSDFFFALSAMIIGIVPIFFIPGLLKSSFAAIGNVGAKLSAMGGRFGRSLGGRVDRSGMARNLRDSRDRRNAMNSAGIRLNKKTGKIEYTRRGRLQNIMPHTTAGKQRIDAARNAAANDILRQKKAGSMMGDAGLSRMAAMDLSAQNREEAQEVQDEIARLSSQENLFDTVKLREALEDEARNATGDEPSLKFKALATALSQRGGEGKKALTSVMRNGGTGAKQLAKYATTGDSGVLSAIGDKDAFAQQYARDLATGNTTATKFDDWLDQTSSGDAAMTNRQFVTANVLDDNERLMAQSGPALQNALDAKDNKSGESIINADRAEGILSDPALVKNKPENAKTIKQQVLPHGVTTERGVSYSIDNTTTGKTDIITGRRTEDGSFIYKDSSGKETVLSASDLAAKKATKVN